MKKLLAVLALLVPLAASAQIHPGRGNASGQTWTVSNVEWTSLVNVTASGNTLAKTGGAPATFDAGAVSVQSVASGDVSVEVVAASVAVDRMFGLGIGNDSASYTDINFGLRATAIPNLQVYENGAARISSGWPTYAVGDILKVECINGVVTYSKNGTVFYTSTVAVGYPMLVDTSINSTDGTLTNVRIGIPTRTTSIRHP